VSAGDLERDDHAVARREVGDLGAYLLDYTHRLVAEDVALLHERRQNLVEVEVGAADRRGRDAYDRVVRLLDRRVGDFVYPDIPLAVPRQRLHSASPSVA
jgi:hypothetical protein